MKYTAEVNVTLSDTNSPAMDMTTNNKDDGSNFKSVMTKDKAISVEPFTSRPVSVFDKSMMQMNNGEEVPTFTSGMTVVNMDDKSVQMCNASASESAKKTAFLIVG